MTTVANSLLESYDRTNTGAQTYTYNGLGDRVRVDKPTGSRRFVYDSQGRVVAEYGASATDVKAEFIWALPPEANDNSPFGGDDGIVGYAPLALVAENGLNQLELYWVHGNHLGVPMVTTNAQGQVVDPGNDFLRPGFPGQSQVLSDLYYNRARDYDPVLGRYIQADPIGLLGGANPYLYANGDPVNLIDPDGELAIQVGGAIIGAGLEVVIQGIRLYASGCDIFNYRNYDGGAIAISAAVGAFAPSSLALAKNGLRSGRAISNLSKQAQRARTPNRLRKVRSRINAHKSSIVDQLRLQIAYQGIKAGGKYVSGINSGGCECGI